ncbi:hypothetical protein HK098_001148 [Nowakowskiella sp. JEL0407]|nr:hypothetical protein HK098_001148 [Nowakowskiella sp. JEL0407]
MGASIAKAQSLGVVGLRELTGDGPVSPYKWDVMISLSSTREAEGRQIEEQLLRRNLNVWVYWKHMSGDMDAAMTEAIKNSRVILFLLCENYCKSPDCVFELKTASANVKRAAIVKFGDGELTREVRDYQGRRHQTIIVEGDDLEIKFEPLLERIVKSCVSS